MNNQRYRFLIIIFLFAKTSLASAQLTSNPHLDVYLDGYLAQDTVPAKAFSQPIKLLPKANGLIILEFTLTPNWKSHGLDDTKSIKSDTLFIPNLAVGNYEFILIENIRARNKYNQILTLNSKIYFIRQ
jgi:hypothetical protein